jgi:hypothetical protein
MSTTRPSALSSLAAVFSTWVDAHMPGVFNVILNGGDLLTRFDIAAQSLRAALMSQTDETAALSEAAREALREMAATVRVVNAAPMRD